MKITFNKEGLTGDNLKLVEDLEKRFVDLPEGKDPAEQLRSIGLLDTDGKATVDLDKLKTLLGDDDKGIRSILKAQGEAIAALGEKGKDNQPKSVGEQIRAWKEENKDALASIKEGTKADLKPLQVRAPITMTVGASAINPVPYYIDKGAEVIDLVRKKPTFWEMLRKGRTSLSSFPWVNKTNKQGNAAFIGEGVLKPLASFELTPEISNAKKVAERMKASTELLYDVEGMETLITDELRYEVMMAANAAVLTGVASSTSPAGVTTIASPYSLTTVKTPNPNNSDAVRAAKAQLISLNFDRDIVAFVNPIDAANMDLAKANNSGVYMLPPFTTADGRVIAGVPVIEDNNIAVGYLLIGDMSKYKVLIYQDFFVAWGWENDDFSKNLVTVIGEMRLHQYSSANWAGAFIYDTFANIKTLLTPAA